MTEKVKKNYDRFVSIRNAIYKNNFAYQNDIFNTINVLFTNSKYLAFVFKSENTAEFDMFLNQFKNYKRCDVFITIGHYSTADDTVSVLVEIRGLQQELKKLLHNSEYILQSA